MDVTKNNPAELSLIRSNAHCNLLHSLPVERIGSYTKVNCRKKVVHPDIVPLHYVTLSDLLVSMTMSMTIDLQLHKD